LTFNPNDDWLVFVRRDKVPLLFASMFFDTLYPKEQVQRLLGFGVEFKSLLRTPTKYYYLREDLVAAQQELSRTCRDNIDYVQARLEYINDALEQTRVDMKRAVRTVQANDYQTSWTEFHRTLQKAFAFLMIKHPLGIVLEDYVDELARHYGFGEREATLLKASHVPEHVHAVEDAMRTEASALRYRLSSFLNKTYGIEFAEVSDNALISLLLASKAASIETASVLWDAVVDFYVKYYWKRTYYWNNDLLTVQEVISYIRDERSAPSLPEKPPGSIPSELLKALRALGLLQVLHTKDIEVLFQARELGAPLLTGAAETLKLPLEHMLYLTQDEMSASITIGRVEPSLAQEAAERSSCYSLWVHEGVSQTYLDNFDNLVQKSESMQSTLTGRSAYPGVIEGRAIVVRNAQELATTPPSDRIVVTKATTVDWEPILAQAKLQALLTEEGGITSHAAKVARELRIPCIVGIANLTSSIRSGDVIRVDATRGEVRRL
jgi:phosphohistidine swiveling domain-containing protein